MIISGGNKKLNGGKVESKNKRVAFFRLTGNLGKSISIFSWNICTYSLSGVYIRGIM